MSRRTIPRTHGVFAPSARFGVQRSTDAPVAAQLHDEQVIDPDPPTVDGAAARRQVNLLIELGRDREAAELAGALDADESRIGEDPSQNRGAHMDVFSQLDELGPLLAGVVSNISSDQLDNPSPCTEFDVRGVLEHMVGGATQFAAAFRGVEPAPQDTADVLAAFLPALGELAGSIHEPGALERAVEAPFGTVPGAQFARFVVLDGLVHGWDLATATGQSYEPSDALVAEVDAFAREAVPPLRDGTTFTDAVEPAATATPIERLVAFTGRSV